MEVRLVNPFGPYATAAPAAIGNFTTKRDVSTLPIPKIPSGLLSVGKIIKIEAEGEYSTTGTPTLTWGLYLGTHDETTGTVPTVSTDIALSSVITTPSAAAAFDWRLEWRGRITKVGTAGTMVGNGTLEQGITLTTRSSFPIPITQALRTVTINTTIDNYIGVSATWGTASVSNTITTYDISVLLLN